MLSINKEDRRIMRNQQQEDNHFFTFFPHKGMGKITFDLDEKKIRSLIGKPKAIYKQDLDNNIGYNYTISGINFTIFFHYEEEIFDYSSIHSEVIIFNNCSTKHLTKEEILYCIKDYYDSQHIDFYFEKTEDDIEDCYFFEAIGLTIWFEQNNISDISMAPVF